MRKILIPTDFSDNAMNALRYACELFKYDICEFFIMHAYEDEIYAEDSLSSRESLEDVTNVISKKSKTQLKALLKHVNKMSPNPKHSYKIVSSNSILLDAADKVVDKKNIDIIVMGTRGITNDKKITFGSHTLQVLKYVQCPVLAIPNHYKYKQPKHILFPTNYLIPYKRRELKLLCEMASPFRATIDMLYISKSETLSLRQQDNRNFIEVELHKNIINFKTINDKNITNAIYTYIKENSIDMLVMVNSRLTFLESILFKTTIDKMSLYLDIPFLALQNINRENL